MNVLYADTRLGGVVKWVYGDPSADMRVPRELIDCVCYLCTKVHGEWKYGGTAFFVSYPPSDARAVGWREHLYVVTARHSLKEIEKLGGEVCLRINTTDGGAQIIIPRAEWFYPDSDSSDAAVLPWRLLVTQGLHFKCVEYNSFATFTYPGMPGRGVGVGDDLLITGLFSMHYGSQRNYPIARAGILAALPDEPLVDEKTGGSYDAYLAEVRSIGGLSGSPVFIVHRPPNQRIEVPGTLTGFFGPKYETVVAAPSAFYLLGLMRSHWIIDTGPLKPLYKELPELNMGIAVVTPIKEVTQVLESEKLKELRLEDESAMRAKNAPKLD
jgi:hypothetical protein